ARLLLDALGCERIELSDGEAGVFPHPPEPVAEHLTDLCERVRSTGAAIGFAQDPDADRLAIVDERGRFIGEEYTLVLAARALLSSRRDKGGVVAANLSTSRMIDDVAAAHGVEVMRTPVGEANVVAGMRAAGERCVLGGEGNGGVIWPDVCWIRDSVSAMALVLALLTREEVALSELIGSLPRYAIVKQKVAIREGLAERAIDAVQQRWRGGSIDLQDGVRVDFPDRKSWVQVRASNTEPIIRIIAEGPEQSDAESLVSECRGAIEAIG
ncbi:MAG: phosphoglucosamine mutase, partial [Planctomycetota bacterium]|nr:phosphoglucosamine mutase [Planctomycetota bacterium]